MLLSLSRKQENRVSLKCKRSIAIMKKENAIKRHYVDQHSSSCSLKPEVLDGELPEK